MKTMSINGGRHAAGLHSKERYAPERAQPTVVTIVEPSMRSQIDFATSETISKVHVGTVREAALAVRQHAPRTLLLSPAVVSGPGLPLLARLLLSSPSISAVALVSAGTGSVEETLLHLGACGVRRAIALTGENVWPRLRAIIGDGALQCDPSILTRILEALDGASPATRCFFVGLVRAAPSTSTVRELSREMNVQPSTLMSRFYRAGLPAPKLYLAMTRLTYAASLLAEPAVSIASVAYHLRFSSPQSFGRHLRTTLGLTAGEFRREVTMQSAIDHFIAKLVVPHLAVFSTFKPIGHLSISADRCQGRESDVVA